VKELLSELASMPGVELNAPASAEEIASAETELGATFPEEVRDYYRTCNGLLLENGPDFPDLISGVRYLKDVRTILFSQLLVVVDNQESNPICVFHKGPLRGYAAHVFHDGDSRVRWRSFGSLLRRIRDQLSSDGDVDVEELPGDLDEAFRSEHDIEAGRGMIQFANTTDLDEADRPIAYGFAFDLLGDGQVAEIAPFLEHEDMFVARAARDRLGQLKGQTARKALAKHREEMKALVKYCAELFQRAGRSVTIEREFNIFVEPGRMGLNLEAIYTQRKRPDFDQWVLGIGRRG
jgi:hypothetical protein